MYIPAAFAVDDPEVLYGLIEASPLATVISHTTEQGLFASQIPLHLDRAAGALGTLRGHISRANPQSRYLEGHSNDVLIVFAGPQSYITPSLYEEKGRSGRVVPTWNYAVVHVYATVSLFDDAELLKAHLETLTDSHEQHLLHRWKVSDAPPEFIANQMKGIIGLAFAIRRIEGKWKVSQNRSDTDAHAISKSLRQSESAASQAVGEMVLRHRPRR